MKLTKLLLALLSLCLSLALWGEEGAAPAKKRKANKTASAITLPPPAPRQPLWEARLPSFSEADYSRQVENLVKAWEESSGKRIVPGAKGRVGIKIYTDSGPGMATPIALTKAVIRLLEDRGYRKDKIFLVGLNQMRLRMTGYLPSYITGTSPFDGHPVYVLESNRYYDASWFYDSPLPARFDPIFMESHLADVRGESDVDEERKSFLATPLFLDGDFWINLPVYTDHPTLGVNGSLVNATLWNASNTSRFFRSPGSAPAAVAEMSAIPELRDTWLFTIASLEHYQYVGGPYFNSLYTVSEPILWLSKDPVLIDALILDRINTMRRKNRFQPVSEEIRTLEFAETLGVGSAKIAEAKVITVGP
jgi:hypothetical protein